MKMTTLIKNNRTIDSFMSWILALFFCAELFAMPAPPPNPEPEPEPEPEPTPLSIVSEHALNFGASYPGDSAQVVAPNDRNAGLVQVFGEAGAKVDVVLSSYNVWMQNASGDPSPDSHLIANSITHPLTLTLDERGKAVFGVGATQAALALSQIPGSYVGELQVCVQYESSEDRSCTELLFQSEVIQALSISQEFALDFGQVCMGEPFIVHPFAPEAASFLVLGEPHQTFTVQPIADTVLYKNGDASDFVHVEAFSMEGATTLDSAGQGHFQIGATAYSGQDTAPGYYSGFFNVGVLYTTASNVLLTGDKNHEVPRANADNVDALAQIEIIDCEQPDPEPIPLSMTINRDLSFGETVAGSPAYTIPSDNSYGSAAFEIYGAPGAIVEVSLSTSGQMDLIGGVGAPDEQVGFETLPSSQTIQLDVSGSAVLYVGGTRAATSMTQMPGAYAGTFSVCVNYPENRNGACENGTATMAVVNMLSITREHDLNFGEVCRNSGSVHIPPFAPEAARFGVTGEPFAIAQVMGPWTDIAMQRVGGHPGEEVILRDFLMESEIQLDATGQARFEVGASAWLQNELPLGTYVGTFPVQALYMSQNKPSKKEFKALSEAFADASMTLIDCDD